MIQEVMTVHKALCELKMLDKRINESIMSAEFCRANKHSMPTSRSRRTAAGRWDRMTLLGRPRHP